MRVVNEFEAMAMLDLPDSERELLSGRLSELAAGFAVLDEINAEGVAPLVTVLGLHNVLREDAAEKRFSRDELLANAPERHEGYFQVPGTL